MVRITNRWVLLFVMVLSSSALCYEVHHIVRDYVGPLFKGSTDFVDDFQFFYEAAGRALQSPDSLYERNTSHGFLFIESGARCDYGYPPPAVLFFLPLALLPLRWAFAVFILCSMVLTGLSVRFIRALLDGEKDSGLDRVFWGITTVSILSLGPVYVTLAFGQVNALVLMFSLGYVWAVKKERFLAAGVLMGLGFWLKFYPLFLLVLAPLEKRPVRLLFASLVSIAALPLLLSPVLPLDLYTHYFREIYPGLAEQTAPHVYNQSWIGFFTRLSGLGSDYFSWGPVLIDPEVKTINSLLQVVLFGWIAWGYSRNQTHKFLYYACVMAVTPMVVTYGWGGTYMLAIPLLLLAWVRLMRGGAWACAGFLLLLAVFIIPAYRSFDLVAWRGGVVEQVYYSRYLIAALVLLLVMVYRDAFGRGMAGEEFRP